MIEGSGEIIWADDEGRVGMLFSRLTPSSRRALKAWLSKRGAGKRAPRMTLHAGKQHPSPAASH